MDVVVNYWAVLVATVVSFVIGSVWYSPVLFVKPWMKSLGISGQLVMKNMGKTLSIGFISILVQAYILAHFVAYTGSMTAMDGVILGAWIWLGFVAMYTVSLVIYERRSMTWFWITNGYQLVSLVVMGAILAVWK